MFYPKESSEVGCRTGMIFIFFSTLVSLLLLLLIRDPPCFSLKLPHLPKINADCTGSKGIHLWWASILFISSSEPPYESIKAAPSLSKRAGARCRRLRLSIKHTPLKVNFGLSELVKVSKKVQHMVAIALGERDWGSLILQVLAKGVPVPSFLWLITAWCCWLLVLMIAGRAWRSLCKIFPAGHRGDDQWDRTIWFCWLKQQTGVSVGERNSNTYLAS